MDTRKRIFNIGFLGEDALQRELLLTVMSRNLKEREKSRKKIMRNPKNFVINNLSNGHTPNLSLIRTPGDVRYIKNILSGCFVSEYLLFVIPISYPRVSEGGMEIEESSIKIIESDFWTGFNKEIEEYSILELIKYTKKPFTFVFVDKDALMSKDSVFQKSAEQRLAQERIEEYQETIRTYLLEQKIYSEVHTLFLQTKEDFEQKLETFIYQELLTKRLIIRLRNYSSSLSKTRSSELKNEVKQDEDVDEKIEKKTRVFVLRAYKNFDTQRLVLFSKVITGAIEACSIDRYWITQNFDKVFRFDDIQIGGIRVPKCVAGEVVALSFRDEDVFPFFLRKSLVFENDPEWLRVMEKGVQFVKARVFMFGKVGFKAKIGSKFTMHCCSLTQGVTIIEINEADEEKLEYVMTLSVGNLGLDVYENCQDLGSFAILEKRRFLGYGEITEIITG